MDLLLRPAAPMARALQRLALAEAMDPACDGALRGDLAAVQQHLQAASKLEGYSINAKGSRARTPLYQACLGKSPEVAEWLLAQGAVDDDGSAYICICATGAERSADPGERTAAIMRRYGFSGRQTMTSDIVRADGASGKRPAAAAAGSAAGGSAMAASSARWEFKDGKWKPLSSEASAVLEAAHAASQPTLTLTHRTRVRQWT